MPVGTREETRLIQVIFALVVVPLVLCVIFGVQLSNKNERVKEKIDAVTKSVDRYVTKKGSLPSMQRIMKAKTQFESMRDYYESIVSFAVVKPIVPPEDVVEKGVYFKERLYAVQKQLKERAGSHETILPESIGFGEALPVEQEVPRLLRKLETVETVMNMAIAARVEAITVVKLLDDKKFDAKDAVGPFTEISVRIDMVCSYDESVSMLHSLGNAKPFLVVRDISMKPAKEGRIDFSIVVSRFIDERTA